MFESTYAGSKTRISLPAFNEVRHHCVHSFAVSPVIPRALLMCMNGKYDLALGKL
jgi:hypothetical protein